MTEIVRHVGVCSFFWPSQDDRSFEALSFQLVDIKRSLFLVLAVAWLLAAGPRDGYIKNLAAVIHVTPGASGIKSIVHKGQHSYTEQTTQPSSSRRRETVAPTHHLCLKLLTLIEELAQRKIGSVEKNKELFLGLLRMAIESGRRIR